MVAGAVRGSSVPSTLVLSRVHTLSSTRSAVRHASITPLLENDDNGSISGMITSSTVMCHVKINLASFSTARATASSCSAFLYKTMEYLINYWNPKFSIPTSALDDISRSFSAVRSMSIIAGKNLRLVLTGLVWWSYDFKPDDFVSWFHLTISTRHESMINWANFIERILISKFSKFLEIWVFDNCLETCFR